MAEIQAIVAHLTVRNAVQSLEFYKKAFDFEARNLLHTPDGKLLHAELERQGQVVMIADEFERMGDGSCASPQKLGGTTVTIHLNSPDVDAAFAQAIAAGAKVTMPLADMFWGSRYGQLIDPYGHHWSIATQKEEVSPTELQRRADSLFSKWKKP